MNWKQARHAYLTAMFVNAGFDIDTAQSTASDVLQRQDTELYYRVVNMTLSQLNQAIEEMEEQRTNARAFTDSLIMVERHEPPHIEAGY